MNTTTRHSAGTFGRLNLAGSRKSAGAFWALLTTAGSFGLGALALATASGVTQLTDTDYDTEFLNGKVLWLVYLLLGGVYLATRKYVLAGFAAAVGLAAGQTWATTVCVSRYHESGWSDGLEILGYLVPILFGVYALIVVLVTWLVRRPRAWN